MNHKENKKASNTCSCLLEKSTSLNLSEFIINLPKNPDYVFKFLEQWVKTLQKLNISSQKISFCIEKMILISQHNLLFIENSKDKNFNTLKELMDVCEIIFQSNIQIPNNSKQILSTNHKSINSNFNSIKPKNQKFDLNSLKDVQNSDFMKNNFNKPKYNTSRNKDMIHEMRYVKPHSTQDLTCFFHYMYGVTATNCKKPCMFLELTKNKNLIDETKNLNSKNIPKKPSNNNQVVQVKPGPLYYLDTGSILKDALIVTGSQFCIAPFKYKGPMIKKSSVNILNANLDNIKVFGVQNFKLDLGPGKIINHNFIIADVIEPIIGIDFLIKHSFDFDYFSSTLFDVNDNTIKLKRVYPFENIVIESVFTGPIPVPIETENDLDSYEKSLGLLNNN